MSGDFTRAVTHKAFSVWFMMCTVNFLFLYFIVYFKHEVPICSLHFLIKWIQIKLTRNNNILSWFNGYMKKVIKRENRPGIHYIPKMSEKWFNYNVYYCRFLKKKEKRKIQCINCVNVSSRPVHTGHTYPTDCIDKRV